MAEAKAYTGGCHCGAVRFEATADLEKVISCNCSFCSKKAPLLAFVPASAFTPRSGADDLQDYLFNRQVFRASTSDRT